MQSVRIKNKKVIHSKQILNYFFQSPFQNQFITGIVNSDTLNIRTFNFDLSIKALEMSSLYRYQY